MINKLISLALLIIFLSTVYSYSENQFLFPKKKPSVFKKIDININLENPKNLPQRKPIIQEESQKRVSFYDMINDINKNLDKKEKIGVLKMLWEIAYADKVLDVDEERIIRRSAEMLGIKPSIVLQTKEEFKNQ